MKRSIDMKKYLTKGLLLGALSLAAANAGAVDYYLAAKAYNKTMPDGVTVVPMWGYVEDTGGACYGITGTGSAAQRRDCVAALPDPVSPGLRLTVADSDIQLRIYLTNTLPEPTSIVITGQELPWSGNGANAEGPVWDDGSHGGRNGNAIKKVRSFVAEANANGGRRQYVWNNGRGTPFVKAGTFMYHSGTDPQKQVYMGLYGAVTKDAVAAVDGLSPAQAYAGVPYDNEVVLFYSEIDPVQNAAVAAGTHTTSIHYHAKWFLINGEPYSKNCTDLVPADGSDDRSGYPCSEMAETLDISAGDAGSRTLLRFLSAAGETHVPTLQGMHMTIYAEDGNPYNWQNGDAVGGSAARDQYSIMLPPLKTKDAVITPPVAGRFAIYDGNGYMTNPTDSENFSVSDPVGGMLRFLSVVGGANEVPIAGPDTATAIVGRTITIDVLANDSDPEGQPLTIDTFGAASGGTVFCDTVNPGGSCDFMATGAAGTSGSFTYGVTDGTNTVAGVAVTVSITANTPPSAMADAGQVTDAGTPISIDVLANDDDADGDALVVTVTTTPTSGTVVVNPDNTITYTLVDSLATSDSFDYTIEDIDGAPASATVTISINLAPPVNSAPIANDDSYSAGEASVLNVPNPTMAGVLDNDTDADGNTLTVSAVNGSTANVGISISTVNGGTVTLNDDGSFSYQSTPNFAGEDTFTYIANDGTDDSVLEATVTINVTAVNDTPVANDDTFFLNSMSTTAIAAPGVLDNDDDPDGDELTAQNGVASQGDLVLNSAGSFDYTPQGDTANVSVGTIATFTYEANDGIATSATATATLNRKLSVFQAICEPRGNGNCDWRIEGDRSRNGRVEAWVGALPGNNCNRDNRRAGNCIRSNGGGGLWTINANNSSFNTAGAPISLRIYNDPDSELLNVTTE